MPSFHLRTMRHQDVNELIFIRLEFLRRVSDRTRRFLHLAQVDCGELNSDVADLIVFATWFCRTSGERAYLQRLYTLFLANKVISAFFGVTSTLFCLGQRVSSGFHFLSHGRRMVEAVVVSKIADVCIRNIKATCVRPCAGWKSIRFV